MLCTSSIIRNNVHLILFQLDYLVESSMTTLLLSLRGNFKRVCMSFTNLQFYEMVNSLMHRQLTMIMNRIY